jgi:hypothetical protein
VIGAIGVLVAVLGRRSGACVEILWVQFFLTVGTLAECEEENDVFAQTHDKQVCLVCEEFACGQLILRNVLGYI